MPPETSGGLKKKETKPLEIVEEELVISPEDVLIMPESTAEVVSPGRFGDFEDWGTVPTEFEGRGIVDDLPDEIPPELEEALRGAIEANLAAGVEQGHISQDLATELGRSLAVLFRRLETDDMDSDEFKEAYMALFEDNREQFDKIEEVQPTPEQEEIFRRYGIDPIGGDET